jgi:hypothetical protein
MSESGGSDQVELERLSEVRDWSLSSGSGRPLRVRSVPYGKRIVRYQANADEPAAVAFTPDQLTRASRSPRWQIFGGTAPLHASGNALPSIAACALLGR